LRPWFTALCAVLVAGLLSGGTQLQVQFALPAAMAGVLLWAILYGVINGQSLAERLQIATPSGRALSRRSAPGEG